MAAKKKSKSTSDDDTVTTILATGTKVTGPKEVVEKVARTAANAESSSK